MSTTPSALQLIEATIKLMMQPANVVDMNTLWTRLGSGPVAYLGQDIADQTAASFVFQQAAPQSIVGHTLLIDNEPVSVTALSADGLTATVVRWRTAFPFMQLLPTPPSDSHKAGVGLMQLQYPDPWTYIAQRYLLPNFQQEVMALGPLAMTFGTLASGSLALASSGQS